MTKIPIPGAMEQQQEGDTSGESESASDAIRQDAINGHDSSKPQNGYEEETYECDYLQLHLIGSIQGKTGHVIHVSYPLGNVVAVDAEILHLRLLKAPSWAQENSDLQPSAMIGTSLRNWLPEDTFNMLFMAMLSLKRDRVNRAFRFSNGYAFTVTVANSDNYQTMAIEIEEEDEIKATDSYRSSLEYLSRLMDLYANETIVKMACDNLFELFPNYDRGLVYRFNDDLSGEVIHEVRRGKVDTTYLGHRFPKYDIPQSARELYKKNILRYIRDSSEPDVPVLSKNDAPVDLTQLRCRACAKPHLVYMKNMGVTCSLSIAILVDNELWGLFAFHGLGKPFQPSLHQRISVETVASMVSSRVEALMRKHGSARIISMGESLMRWSPNNSLESNLSELGLELLDIAEADVLVTLLDGGKVVVAGDESLVPNDKAWEILAKHPNGELWTASTRADIHGLGLTKEDCPASGFVYFHEGTTQLFLGRRSISKDVKWAGKPDQPKLRDAQGMLNPRNSFEMYMEKAKEESRSWSTSDLNVILVLKDRVCSGHAHEWMTALLRNDIEEANIRYFAAMDRARDNSDFFSHMCHELRTPFHGVMGCLNILHDSIDTMPAEEVKDMIKTALSSGNHMINILNDILNKSKNKILLNKTVRHTVYFATLAKEAFVNLKALAKNLEVEFQYQVIPEDQDIVIATDRTKITQIVSNIVNNALKFSERGPIMAKIHIVQTLADAISEMKQCTRSEDGFVFSMEEGKMLTCIDDVKDFAESYSNGDASSSKKQWLCLSVSDSGIGMRPNELAQVFEPYTQGDAVNQVLVGTGLGLYICVSLCHQLGGFIACSSTPDQGTHFFVSTPVEILHGGDGLQQNDNGQDDYSSSTIPLYGPILIVDDNKINVKILHRQLSMELKKSKLDVELIDAFGGEEALELYKNRLPSIVIIDYHMPGMDGVAATKRMRKYEEDQDLRKAYILSYTADTSDIAAEVLIACGSNQIMSKPPVKGFVADLVKRIRVQTSTEVMTNYRRSSAKE